MPFPNFAIQDFDRYPHSFRGDINKYWDKLDWPFDICTLPRLPSIHNPDVRNRARTLRSLPAARGPELDFEKEAFQRLRDEGDALLQFYATEAVVAAGSPHISEDIVVRLVAKAPQQSLRCVGHQAEPHQQQYIQLHLLGVSSSSWLEAPLGDGISETEADGGPV